MVVIGHLSLVIGVVFGVLGFGVADGLEVGVQAFGKSCDDGLNGRSPIFRDQLSFVSTTEEVADFAKRAPGNADETFVVGISSSSVAFGDISTHRISRSHELVSYSITSELIPLADKVPNFIGQLFRRLINPELLKGC